jgi:hypothetical protein
MGGAEAGLALLERQPQPPAWVVLVAAVLALAAVAHRPSWRVLRHVVTIAHEGGHATAAVATGRRLRGIRLHSDTSGVTLSSGRPRGPGMVLTAASGYVAPSLVGLAGAGALTGGRVSATLWGAAALLALLLVQIRNVFGVLSVVLTGAVAVLLAVYGSPQAQGAAAYLLVWFLLLAGPRPVWELQRSRRAGRAPTSDADQLGRLTGVPAVLWVGAFFLITFGVAACGAWLLVRPVV